MESLKKLEDKMQKKIIDAAFLEFSSKGYENASTNEIIKNANISKGKLFYHFDTKQKLYQYLVSIVLNKLKTFIDLIDIKEKDILIRYSNMVKLQMEFFNDDSALFLFMGSIIKNDIKLLDNETYLEYLRLSKLMKQKKDNIENIDRSKFIEHIDSDIIIQLIHLTLKGYEQQLRENYANTEITYKKFEDSVLEFEMLLANIRKVYYKKEDQI